MAVVFHWRQDSLFNFLSFTQVKNIQFFYLATGRQTSTSLPTNEQDFDFTATLAELNFINDSWSTTEFD